MEGLTAVLPVSPGPEAFDAAVSAAFRLWEEYPGVERLVLAPTRRARQVAGEARGLLQRLPGVDVVESTLPEVAEEGVADLARELDAILEGAGGGVVLAVSAASRFLAAAAFAAAARAARRGVQVEVVSVHFHFGPWTGLPYPYTPRALEPLVILHPAQRLGPQGRDASRHAPQLDGGGQDCGLPGKGVLPPLRCAVAELTRRLNGAPQPRAVLDEEWRCRAARVLVRYEGRDVARAGLCDRGSVCRAAGRLASVIGDIASRGCGRPECGRWVEAWLGLKRVEAEGGGDLSEAGRLLLDTNLIYWGAHLYAWSGAALAVPECAALEIEKGAAERLKHGVRAEHLDVLAAYLALRDLQAVAPLTPGPPLADCDTAIPRSDILILNTWTPATGDRAAHRLWQAYYRLPRSIVARIGAPRGCSTWAEASWAYYAFHQAIILLALASGNKLELYIDKGAGGWERVPIPLRSFEGELPWASRGHQPRG
jgi:hypothetical protein